MPGTLEEITARMDEIHASLLPNLAPGARLKQSREILPDGSGEVWWHLIYEKPGSTSTQGYFVIYNTGSDQLSVLEGGEFYDVRLSEVEQRISEYLVQYGVLNR